MNFRPKHMFYILCALFLLYSFSIYIKPLSIKEESKFNKEKAADGRLVWQSYNCQSCHQLYSLGGYLGPDLTNIISNPNKGETIVRAMIKSGTKQMPAFSLTDTEMNSLIEFLKSTDASGKADPREFYINKFGMIEENESE
ncbi:MAG: cytochrome c [Bacteroidetes bacterium]|jgi:nitric oxide reductase subunit C|nr:cytochrome c [Bacteroidota bacterium]